MSIHKSLALGKAGAKHRNVLTREERMAKLGEQGRWDEAKSVFGLPKVRSIKVAAVKKAAKKPKPAEAVAVEGAVEGAADAPAAGAAKAAPAAPGAPKRGGPAPSGADKAKK